MKIMIYFQDMVECELLDRLSILTYLAQFYQAFHGSIQPGKIDGSKVVAKRTTSSASNSSNSSPLRTPSKAPLLGRRNEPCRICNKGKHAWYNFCYYCLVFPLSLTMKQPSK